MSLEFFKNFRFFSGIEHKNCWLIVGLGNFGDRYKNTRHNVGFDAIDRLSEKYGVELSKRKFKSLVNSVKIENQNCILMKPLTFMNNSGEAVKLAKDFYKVNASKILILSDDISFEPGIIKIKKKGSSGGHNGLQSVIFKIDTEDFVRIKIGVGKKPTKDFVLSNWVLGKFSEHDRELLEFSFKKILEAVPLIVKGEILNAMGKFNKK